MDNEKLGFCGCCGKDVYIGKDENLEDTYCTECMGDQKSKGIKKRIGWAGQCFYEARFPIIRKTLPEEKRAKWDAFTYEKKCVLVGRCIEKGIMI